MRIDEIGTWCLAHQADLWGAFIGLWAFISTVVRLTPTTKDDAFLHRVCQRVSLLAPHNTGRLFSIPGFREWAKEDPIGPMMVLLLCLAPLLGGCGAKRETLQAVIDFVRASSCAVCHKLNPNDCPEPQP